MSLLKAGLLEKEKALNVWRKIQGGIDFQHLDCASNTLLALIYSNLKGVAPKTNNFLICKNMYRYIWTKNQMLFQSLNKLLALLQSQSVEVMLLKGAAQVINYYKDFGVRTLGDIDVLVSKDMAGFTIKLLLANGWRTTDGNYLPELHNKIMRVEHATNLVNENNKEHINDSGWGAIDLHWSILDQTIGTQVEQIFFQNSILSDFKNRPIRLLHPSDQLIHILAHGVKHSDVSLIRWIMDAITIIRSTPALDWQKVVRHTKLAKFTLPVRLGLQFLRNEFEINIPVDIMLNLNNHICTNDEIYLFKKDLRPRSILDVVGWLWARHSSRMDGSSKYIRIKTFPDFLASRWKIKLYKAPFMAVFLFFRYKLFKSKLS